MAFRYFSRKRDARKFSNALMDANGGRIPTLFRDGKLYRVQDDTIGNERMSELMRECGLDEGR